MDIRPEKKLGFGLMRMPLLEEGNDASVDVEQVKHMVDRFLEAGFTYFDTALMYNGEASEAVAKEALVDRYPRDAFTLATKLHAMYLKTKEDRDWLFEGQLRKTGVDFFDYYLIHGVSSSNLQIYEDLDCFRWLLDKKAQGLVRHAGFSFHDHADLLDTLLTKYPEMEFVQLQLNYLDWESDWVQSRACYEVAKKHGKPVVVMEPVKGGTLAKLPEDAERLLTETDPGLSLSSWAIRFAASQDNVMVVLSGMSDLSQMEDNCSYMENFEPLTQEEEKLCFRAADIINANIAIPCTACQYCVGGCPMEIPIPQYFALYNEDMREDLGEKGWTSTFERVSQLGKSHGSPGDCIACGQCESACPQHLPIIEDLKTLQEHWGR